MEVFSIGKNIKRKEALEKVTGTAEYNMDKVEPEMLHAVIVTSTVAHAKIISINTSEAWKVSGVQAIITGEYFPVLCGTVIEDRPPLAQEKVRYYGEPVAIVVANTEYEASLASQKIKIEYEHLPIVNSPREALKGNAPLIHENLALYQKISPHAKPKPNTNIANHKKIRKGNMSLGWEKSEVIIEEEFYLPQSDHVAMEVRNTKAKILPTGEVIIHTSTQAPFEVKKLISKYFNINLGKVVVHTPLVGGAFGGKTSVQLELLAYLASRAVNGRMVKIANTREQDLVTSPCRLGLEAKVKLGATKKGKIIAAEFTYMVNSGSYADITPRMASSMAINCTGPYNIENVHCDSYSVYTNHPFATAFRGFGHSGLTFCIERALEKLAFALQMDSASLRLKNAISSGHTSPTQVRINDSNAGNLTECINKVKELINWEEGIRIDLGNNIIRAKGMSCLWKSSNSPTNAISGVILTFNTDGSININCGAVEFGPGMKTTVAQILAERLKMDINKIHVLMEVNTRISPEHWKTVASMTTFMLGRAVLQAAEDLVDQLCNMAAIALRCPPEDLEVSGEKVYLKDDPSIFIEFFDIVHGFKYPNGNAIGGQIMGIGKYIMRHLTPLDPNTGKGKPGISWTVGAQAVEVELNTKDYTYKILRAATAIDVGRVINPKTARGVVMGGMCMGLSLASRESFLFGNNGEVLNTSLRNYKLIRYGENPEYLVEFIETPQVDAPYGARCLGEHGIVGIPAALANSLSTAAEVELNFLPLSPESIWKAKVNKE